MRGMYKYWAQIAPTHIQALRIAQILGYEPKIRADDQKDSFDDLQSVMPGIRLDIPEGQDAETVVMTALFGEVPRKGLV